MKKIAILFVTVLLVACNNNKTVDVLAGNGTPDNYTKLTASYTGKKPEKGSLVYALIKPSSTEIINHNSKYPKKDTAWYEGSNFFQIVRVRVD